MQLWLHGKKSSLIDKEFSKWSVPSALVFCLKSALSGRKGRSRTACQITHWWRMWINVCKSTVCWKEIFIELKQKVKLPRTGIFFFQDLCAKLDHSLGLNLKIVFDAVNLVGLVSAEWFVFLGWFCTSSKPKLSLISWSSLVVLVNLQSKIAQRNSCSSGTWIPSGFSCTIQPYFGGIFLRIKVQVPTCQPCLASSYSGLEWWAEACREAMGISMFDGIKCFTQAEKGL